MCGDFNDPLLRSGSHSRALTICCDIETLTTHIFFSNEQYVHLLVIATWYAAVTYESRLAAVEPVHVSHNNRNVAARLRERCALRPDALALTLVSGELCTSLLRKTAEGLWCLLRVCVARKRLCAKLAVHKSACQEVRSKVEPDCPINLGPWQGMSPTIAHMLQ